MTSNVTVTKESTVSHPNKNSTNLDSKPVVMLTTTTTTQRSMTNPLLGSSDSQIDTMPMPSTTTAGNITSTGNDSRWNEVLPPTLTSITEKLNQFNVNESNVGVEPMAKGRKTRMDILLHNAQESLQELCNSLSNDTNATFYKLFNEAKGIIFLSVAKGCFGVGGEFGSGIVMTNVDNKWSGPCAVSVLGIQIGLGFGVEKVNHVLLIRDEFTLKLFENKRAWKIGTDLSVAAGFIGGDMNIGVAINEAKNIKPVYSYSIAKGAYVGISLNGSLISVEDDWNAEYYGRKMNVPEILHNYVITPNSVEYLSLVRFLNENCLKNEK